MPPLAIFLYYYTLLTLYSTSTSYYITTWMAFSVTMCYIILSDLQFSTLHVYLLALLYSTLLYYTSTLLYYYRNTTFTTITGIFLLPALSAASDYTTGGRG